MQKGRQQMHLTRRYCSKVLLDDQPLSAVAAVCYKKHTISTVLLVASGPLNQIFDRLHVQCKLQMRAAFDCWIQYTCAATKAFVGHCGCWLAVRPCFW